MSREEKRIAKEKHEKESVKLATEILAGLNYDKRFVPEILEIILLHDTREGFISANERAMRDADKLFPF